MNLVARAFRVLREQGPSVAVTRVGMRLFGTHAKRPLLVRYDDALAADWSTPHPAVASPRAATGEVLRTAWIMSPPGYNSGGHQNIFRFIKYLEDAGHSATVYLYSSAPGLSAAEVKEMMRASSSYPELRGDVLEFPEDGLPADLDAIVATGWETAYPSFLDPSPARRFYFVQDFEPYFYPAGSEYVLAENSYRFGFQAITAGSWLSAKLSSEYGLTADAFEFGADTSVYSVTNTGPRPEIFFYARPTTERRGFELGLMALHLVHRERPDLVINLVGEDVGHVNIPFPHRNLRGLQVGDLNEVYNRCAAGLVLSFTNMSLLPLELLAAGVIPVVNDGENNRLVSDNPFIAFAPATPGALARRILDVVASADPVAASQSVASTDWDSSGRRFVSLLEGALRG